MANQPKIRYGRYGDIIFNTKDEDEIAAIMSWLCDEDGAEKFMKFFWPDMFMYDPVRKIEMIWNWQRKEYAKQLSDPSIPYYWVMATRSFAKTTIMLGEACRVILFRLTSFLLWTASELSLAIARTEMIKDMLSTPRVREWFGNIKPQFEEGSKDVWNAKSFVVVDPYTNISFCAIVPNSENQTINGKLFPVGGRPVRPEYLVNDDGEDRGDVQKENLRKKHRVWIEQVLLLTVPLMRPDPDTGIWPVRRGERPPYVVRFMDTNKHYDCYIARLSQQSQVVENGEEVTSSWKGSIYPIAYETSEGKFISLMPDIWTDKQCEAEFRKACNDPDIGIDGFFREYLCSSVRRTKGTFPAQFQRYTDDMSLNEADVYRILITDPTRVVNERSCPASILIVAIDPKRARIYLRRAITKKITYEDYYEFLFDVGTKYNCQYYCIEGLDSDDALKKGLENAAKMRKLYPKLVHLRTQTRNMSLDQDEGLDPKTAAKRRRASTAVLLYNSKSKTHPHGHIWHDHSLKGSDTEGQLLSYPYCAKWDGIDCVGHIQQSMAAIDIKWRVQLPEDDPEFGKDHERYEDIVEAVLSGDWRCGA